MTAGVLRSDGGARGNPGPAGIGFVIEVDGQQVCSGGHFLGSYTNNVAEYQALIWGLENARELGLDYVTVYADSELMVKQINGAYRVKNAGLKPLFVRALQLLRDIGHYEVIHVRRVHNRAADALANEAMDTRSTVGDYRCAPHDGSETASLF